jgi:hypothetical protein
MDDDAVKRQQLDDAERELRESQEHVDRQKTLIEQQRSGGHDVSTALRVLKALEHQVTAFKHHRNLILEELGLYRTGESGKKRAVRLPSMRDEVATQRAHPKKARRRPT